MSVAQATSSFHFAMIPEHVAHAPVSERAKGLWREMALKGGPKVPNVWIRQDDFAKTLDCSVKTVQRALDELLEAGLIKFTKAWHQGRHKIYKLFFTPEKPSADATYDKNVASPTTPVSHDVGQICRNINKEDNHNKTGVKS